MEASGKASEVAQQRKSARERMSMGISSWSSKRMVVAMVRGPGQRCEGGVPDRHCTLSEWLTTAWGVVSR